MGDYSCYITIVNQLDAALTKEGTTAVHGYWNIDPPDTIDANSTSKQFQLKDYAGAYGTEGSVTYRVELEDVPTDADKPRVIFNFQCPVGTAPNLFTMSVNVAGTLFVLDPGTTSTSGHPMYGNGSVSFNKSISGPISPVKSVVMPDPKLNVYNSKGTLNKKKNLEIWNSSTTSNYEDNDTSGIPGSYYPVSVDLTETPKVNVTLNLDTSLTSIPFYIQGNLGTASAVIRSDNPQFFSASGSHKISMIVDPTWSSKDFPWAVVGDVVWKITIGATDQVIQSNTSRLEIYSMVKSLPTLFANRIDVGALRVWIRPAYNSSETDWTSYVINSAFSKWKYVFDSDKGAAKFVDGGSGGNYKLASWVWLITTETEINDYDQAGIVQIALYFGLKGGSEWMYMSPYGYIVTTPLVGVGSCNNPLYGSNGTNAIISNNDAKRTGFKNHAFLKVTSKNNQIADACIGPHVVSESLDSYISASIQKDGDDSTTTTTLYRSHTDMGPGVSSNASKKSGVTSIDGRTSNSSSQNYVTRTASASASMFFSKSFTAEVDSLLFTNLDLPKIDAFLRKGHKDIIYHSSTLEENVNHLAWFIRNASGPPTTIEISVHPTLDRALQHFKDSLLSYQAPLEDIFVAPKGTMRKGEYCIVTPANSRRGHMSWVRGNIFARVSGPLSIQELHDVYIAGLDETFVSNQTKQGTLLIPKVTNLPVPPRVKEGEEFTVYASVVGSKQSRVNTGDNIVVTLLEEDSTNQRFRFLAGQAGKEIIKFYFAHPISGVVVTKAVEVSSVRPKG